MEDLRRRSGQEKRHRTLGFYSSTLATKVEPGRVVARANDCELAVRVTGDFRLTERRIHIAREMASLPCLSGVVVKHLTHHAVAEGEAFNRLVARVERRLSSATFSAEARAERGQGDGTDILIKAAMGEEIAVYDADRKQMRDETDTADEIDKVQNTCF